MLGTNKEVAMKFIPEKYENYAKNEHRAYQTLGAVNNTDKEAYGIPTLYLYGRWQKYHIFATTLLDPEFEQKRKDFDLTMLDILIVFREFVSYIQM